MLEIGTRLRERSDAIAFRHCTMTEPQKLGEDKPHPMRSFLPALDLFQRALVCVLLRIKKALKIELVFDRSYIPLIALRPMKVFRGCINFRNWVVGRQPASTH